MTNIYFRTDGNPQIATGHLSRCLTIARACARKGAAAAFIVSDTQSLLLLQERFAYPDEFPIHCLHTDYTDLSRELPLLTGIAAPDAPDTATEAVQADLSPAALGLRLKPWIFVDSYYADPSYLLSLHKIFRVAYLDDLRAFDCPVDLVINYDTGQDCSHYAAAARKLLGVQYTPLRAQFGNTPYTVRPAAGHILLSTGGTDPYAVAEHLLKAVYHEPPYSSQERPARDHGDPVPLFQDTQVLQGMHYHILTSNANTRYDALVSFAGTHPAVHIHKGVLNVASLMASCDLAVCAGGATLCELCAVGVPTVSYLMADNQRTAVETYAKAGLIPYAGDIRPQVYGSRSLHPEDANLPGTLPQVNSSTVSAILSFMTSMSQNLSARTKSSQSMRAFLDGNGADQIACELTS